MCIDSLERPATGEEEEEEVNNVIVSVVEETGGGGGGGYRFKILELEASFCVLSDPPFEVVRASKIFENIASSSSSSSRRRTCTIYFSRHGESEYNVQSRVGGDAPLTKRGEAYSVALGQYFRDDKTLRVWTSLLKRTIATAGHLNPKIVQERTPLLNEINSGVLEGLSYKEIAQRYPEFAVQREMDKLRYRYPGPGGESYLDCCARIEPVILEMEKHRENESNGDLLIIAHQAILRCFFGYLLNSNPDKIPYIRIPQHTLMKVTVENLANSVEYIQLTQPVQ